MREWLRWRRGIRAKPLALALQGGGAHGAFTWGALEVLLDEPRVSIGALCGTSAGAMNAVVVAQGLVEGGPARARVLLEVFWSRVAGLSWGSGIDAGLRHHWLMLLSHWLSPYQLNPLNHNPLRDLLADIVDFEALRRPSAPRLYIAATEVRRGRVRVFDNATLSLDAVLASACLPQWFQAVEIDGEAYWDGGFTGNPVLYPLIEQGRGGDVLLVQLNPSVRDRVPRDPQAIASRVNEITFNAVLMSELRRLAVRGRAGTRVRLHRIVSDELVTALSMASKLNPNAGWLDTLRSHGADAARNWLAGHADDIGRRASFDPRSLFTDD